jgi:hypothetical protein
VPPVLVKTVGFAFLLLIEKNFSVSVIVDILEKPARKVIS